MYSLILTLIIAGQFTFQTTIFSFPSKEACEAAVKSAQLKYPSTIPVQTGAECKKETNA